VTEVGEKPKLRWYRPTPGRALVGLFLLEAILWLSERCGWFPFNKHPGWTVLIAVAVMLAALAGMVLWFLASLVCRWRFQFGIRFLLAMVAMVAMQCSWLAVEIKAAREQEATMAILEDHHNISWCDEFHASDESHESDEALPEPLDTWLPKLLGVDLFSHVEHVAAWGDEGLECLTGLPYLKKLDVERSGDAEITDAGLKAIGNLVHLEELTICSDDITDDGLEYFKGLASLRSLTICSNAITDAGICHLGGVGSLRRLKLECPEVRGPGLQYLGQLKQLRELSFGYGSSVGNSGLANLKGLRHLRSLQLSFAKIDDVGLGYLEGMHELEDLNVSGREISDAGVAHLKGLTRLRCLDLNFTRITDSGLESLEGLTQLERLYLADTEITDAGVGHLERLGQLKELCLMHTRITKQGRERLSQALPACEFDRKTPVGTTARTRAKKP
jgi:hypothetical protein